MRIRFLIGFVAIGLFGACVQEAEPEIDQAQQAILGGQTLLDGVSAISSFTQTCVMSVLLPLDEDDMVQNPPSIFCTCTLVEKGDGAATVLTAARCVNENVQAELDGESMGLLADIDVRFGDSFSGAPVGDRFGVTAVEMHRYFDPDIQGFNEVALMRLDGEPSGPVVRLRDTPLTDADLQTDAFLVGYGETMMGDMDFGQRKFNKVPVRTVDRQHIFAGTDEITTCVGDSGGPVFFQTGSGVTPDDFEQIAFTVRQFSQCADSIQRLRIDHYGPDFIFRFIDRFTGNCPIDGTCTTSGCRSPDPDCDECEWGNSCKEECPTRDWDCPVGKFVAEDCTQSGECEEFGTCVAAHDDPDFTYCTRRCIEGRDADCPEGMVCTDEQCVFDPAAPSRGSQGFTCMSAAQCRSGICEEQICVDECDPSDPNACASEFGDFTCGPSTVQSGTNVCLGEVLSGGGGFCTPDSSVAGVGSTRGALTSFAILGLVLLSIRRRRNRGRA